MPSRVRQEQRFNHLYSYIDNKGLCVYCGEPATSEDHFVPLSVTHALGDIPHAQAKMNGGQVLVPSCHQCNSIASNKLFSFIGKKTKVHSREIGGKIQKYFGYAKLDDKRTCTTWSELTSIHGTVRGEEKMDIEKNKLEEQQEQRLCGTCKRPFKPTRYWQKFCSHKCRATHNREERRKAWEEYKTGAAKINKSSI